MASSESGAVEVREISLNLIGLPILIVLPSFTEFFFPFTGFLYFRLCSTQLYLVLPSFTFCYLQFQVFVVFYRFELCFT